MQAQVDLYHHQLNVFIHNNNSNLSKLKKNFLFLKKCESISLIATFTLASLLMMHLFIAVRASQVHFTNTDTINSLKCFIYI